MLTEVDSYGPAQLHSLIAAAGAPQFVVKTAATEGRPAPFVDALNAAGHNLLVSMPPDGGVSGLIALLGPVNSPSRATEDAGSEVAMLLPREIVRTPKSPADTAATIHFSVYQLNILADGLSARAKDMAGFTCCPHDAN